MNEAGILDLARAAGLSIDWIDAYGVPQSVAPDTLRLILKALNLPCDTDQQCSDSIARLVEEQADSTVAPLLLGDVGTPLHVPSSYGWHGKGYVVELEDGNRLEGRFTGDVQAPCELMSLHQFGYHRLIVDQGEGAEKTITTLAMAPLKCFGVYDSTEGTARAGSRLWGIAVQLYSLRREGDGGIGDFSALTELVGSAARHGAAAVAISPVHAGFSANTHSFSPYSPSSRIFLSALHIDPAQIAGADAARGLDPVTRAELERLAELELIDWPAAATLRIATLRRLYKSHIAGRDNEEFARFRSQGGEALADHVHFEALHEWFLSNGESGDWHQWPLAYRDPRGPAVLAFAHENADAVNFHAFLQWQAAKGLSAAQKAARAAGMPIGVISDLAVGAQSGGSQAWSRQGEIIDGLSVGAPPDLLNAHGQSWGLGAFSPLAMKRTGFRAYIEMLRAAFAHAGGVRIDHVLGLARLWLVPDGESSKKGAYLRYPIDDLLRLIALESWRHRAIVIGEDLGTIPAGFYDRMARAGVLGIRVLWFQRAWQRFLAPDEWSADAIGTTTTHDLPTFAGWWEGRDIGWRTRLGLLPDGVTEAEEERLRNQDREQLWQALLEAGHVHGAMPPHTAEAAPIAAALAFLGSTPAPLAIVPIEDILGLPEQPNVPGTVDTHPNWRRRMPGPVQSVLDGEATGWRMTAIDQARGR